MDSCSLTKAPATRRSYLRAVTSVGLAGLSGCSGETALVDPNPQNPVSLSIKTVPADDDPYAIRIAQRLAANCREVGIAIEVIPMRLDEFLHDILIRNAFDMYVTIYPEVGDPDSLFPLLHSQFKSESGWQNPFGFSNPIVDDLLVRQRTSTDNDRRQSVFELQRAIARLQPFTVIAFPNSITAVREEWKNGLIHHSLSSPLTNMALWNQVAQNEVQSGPTHLADSENTIRVTYTDRRITRNLNPLAVEYRRLGIVTGLLYDPVLRQFGNEFIPWLGDSWSWQPIYESNDSIATVVLRKNIKWHDNRPITTEDIAFTYKFLSDISSTDDSLDHAPLFRGKVSLIDTVEAIDDHRIQFRFNTINRTIAGRALTVPILPKHEWEPRGERAGFAGFGSPNTPIEALIWNNMDPIGSGPFRLARVVTDQTLILERFAEHFLHQDPQSNLPKQLAEGAEVDRVVFRIVPSGAAATELIDAGEADVAGTALDVTVIPMVLQTDSTNLLLGPPVGFVHVGYNTRREPLSEPLFRRVIARLLNKATIVNDVYHGYALPAASPLTITEWCPPDLKWFDHDPTLPFLGNGDELDVEKAHRAFEQSGYRYSKQGRLLER